MSEAFVTDTFGGFFRDLRNMAEFRIQRLAGAHVWADIHRLGADRDVPALETLAW